MRTLTAPALAALQSRSVPLAILVEMALSTQLNLNTTSLDLVYSGTTYYGTKGLGSINAIQETPNEVRQLQFTLSGVPSTAIALALTEQVQGKLVTVKLAVFDPANYTILDVRTRWAGRLDVMAIDDGSATGTLTISAEHAGIDLMRPRNVLYTDLDQQRLHPGDTGLQFMNDQVDQNIVWPAASFFKK